MRAPIRVGIIGASATGGWARESHVPAVTALAGLELAAIGSSSQSSADAAAEEFGAPVAYGDTADLFADPSIDLVTVATPVPAHRDLLLRAVRAGKHVLSEWPVGGDTQQTREIAEEADRAGVHAVVGLQARANPAFVLARRMLADGAVGRVLSMSVLSTTAGFGPRVPEASLYLEDPASGMNLATIQAAHTLDAAVGLVGELEFLSATFTTQFPDLTVGDPPRSEHRRTADHVSLSARLAGGAVLTAEVAGGRPGDDTPFRLEVVCTDGTLSLVGGAPRGFQSGTLVLEVDGRAQQPPVGETDGLPEPVVNVAGVYAAARDDILAGTSTAPSFEHALHLSRIVDSVFESARDGRRVILP